MVFCVLVPRCPGAPEGCGRLAPARSCLPAAIVIPITRRTTTTMLRPFSRGSTVGFGSASRPQQRGQRNKEGSAAPEHSTGGPGSHPGRQQPRPSPAQREDDGGEDGVGCEHAGREPEGQIGVVRGRGVLLWNAPSRDGPAQSFPMLLMQPHHTPGDLQKVLTVR